MGKGNQVKRRFDAVIFDCDGTLVDSETLGNQVLVDYLAELGIPLSLQEALELFTGKQIADTIAFVESRLGYLPEGFVTELRSRFVPAFEAHLRPMPGVEDVLKKLTIPYCVASSSPRSKLELSLRSTGLLGYFEGRMFSAHEVGSFKPEPGLFLHAAAALGVAPERCAVVEDSATGISAGIAAGMTVFAYAPHGNRYQLEAMGAHLLLSMNALLEYL